MDAINALIEGRIDFKGQHLADQLTQLILTVSSIVAFLVGYISQNITYTVWIMGVGLVSICVIVIPPWPYFRRNPVNWLPVESSNKKEK